MKDPFLAESSQDKSGCQCCDRSGRWFRRGHRIVVAPAEPDRIGEFENFNGEFANEAFERELNRNSSNYVRWVQQALNRIQGSQLVVDGFAGVKTRSAIRSFQTRRGLVADGIVGAKTEAALVAAGAGPAPGGSTALLSAGVCPTNTPVDCPVPGTPATEVLDNFTFRGTKLIPPHTAQINRVASQIISSQSSPQPMRSVLIAGHTDPAGSDDFNFNLGRQRAETVANQLCKTLEGMRPGLARQLTFNLTTCGERQLKATPAASRRVEVFLPKIVSPPRGPITPPKPVCPPVSPGRVPPDLVSGFGTVQAILQRFMVVLGPAGVKLPTTARFLTVDEQTLAKGVFDCSLDFTKILISDGVGFDGRPFTVAVRLASGVHTVLLLGDTGRWETSGRAGTLIHELTHSWQSQHNGNDAEAYMLNSIQSQAAALVDLPIAKAAAGAEASASAMARGVFDLGQLASIGALAAAREEVSAYAYIPGKPFSSYGAEQIAQQVEHSFLGTGRPTPAVVRTIRSVGVNVPSPDNRASLSTISFHRRSTRGVVFS